MTYAAQSLTQTAGAGWSVPAASSGKPPAQDTGTSFQTLLRQACSTHNGTDTDPTQTAAEDTQPRGEDTKEHQTITVDLMALGAAMLAGGISQSQPETTCTAAGPQVQTVQAAGVLTAAGTDIGVTSGTADAAAPVLSDQTAVSPTAQPADTVQADPAAKTIAPAVQAPEEGTAQQDSSAAGEDGMLAASRDRQNGQSDRREDVQVTDRTGSWQAPLFRQTEQMPVKVGEADTLDATEPDFAPRLAKAITEAEQEGARHVELKLAPEHLGKLSVELTQGKDGVLHIVFHAENEQAMKLLQEHSATLVSMLHGSHSGEIQVEVPRPQQGEQPWQQPEQQPGQQHGRNPQEQGRQRQSTEDFLQQLRLGLLGVEAE